MEESLTISVEKQIDITILYIEDDSPNSEGGSVVSA
jgi:hypothetical protein